MKKAWIGALLTACSSFVPTEGTWNTHHHEYRDDMCNAAENDEETVASEPSSFFLAVEEGGFTITPSEKELPIFCSLRDKEFTCTTLLETLEEEEGFSLTMTIDSSGLFLSRTQLQIYSFTTLHCEGDTCSMFEQGFAAELPCTFLGYTELKLSSG